MGTNGDGLASMVMMNFGNDKISANNDVLIPVPLTL